MGTDVLNWDPESLKSEIQETFGVKLHHIPESRLNAAIMALTSNLWMQDIYMFNIVCNGLGDGLVNHEIFEPASPEEIAWTIVEYSLMNPTDKKEPPLETQISNNVKIYVSELLKYHAIRPMGIFAFLQSYYSVPVLDTTDAEFSNAGYSITEAEYDKVRQYVDEGLSKLVSQVKRLGIQSKTLGLSLGGEE